MASLIGNIAREERQDTAGNWTANNPTPRSGEWCYETDTGKLKIGDGVTIWTSLLYSAIPDIDTEISDINTALSGKLTGSTDQICKAWVNFNGTGTVAIRDSFNVSSITDNGTGDYTVNFENAMNDVNYVVFGTSAQGALIGENATTALKSILK